MNDLQTLARDCEGLSAEGVIRLAIERFRTRLVLACSFGGPTGMVALDMAMNVDRTVPVFYLDTGLLFAQTYALVDQVRARYGIAPVAVLPELTVSEQGERYGEALWELDPDACCGLRKVAPQRRFLAQYDAWISGIRRDQSSTRANTPVVQADPQFGLVKFNPFVEWDERMVWAYVRAHDLPYNALHDENFPSIGCVPCTRAVRSGEDLRDGRWSKFNKTECGLHAETSNLK